MAFFAYFDLEITPRTMLFFLKYAKSEDLSLTHTEFRKQVTHVRASEWVLRDDFKQI